MTTEYKCMAHTCTTIQAFLKARLTSTLQSQNEDGEKPEPELRHCDLLQSRSQSAVPVDPWALEGIIIGLL